MRSPEDFIFQASRDGVAWIDLLVVKGFVYDRGGKWREWIFENQNEYPYYRLYIAKGGNPHNLTINQVRLG